MGCLNRAKTFTDLENHSLFTKGNFVYVGEGGEHPSREGTW